MEKRNQKETSHRALHLISNVHLGSWLCYSHKPTQPENIIGYSLLLLLTDRIVWKLYDQFYRRHYSILHKSTDIHMNSNMFEFPAKIRLFSKKKCDDFVSLYIFAFLWFQIDLFRVLFKSDANWPRVSFSLQAKFDIKSHIILTDEFLHTCASIDFDRQPRPQFCAVKNSS